jgi:hypothetical protein
MLMSVVLISVAYLVFSFFLSFRILIPSLRPLLSEVQRVILPPHTTHSKLSYRDTCVLCFNHKPSGLTPPISCVTANQLSVDYSINTSQLPSQGYWNIQEEIPV